MHIRELRKTGFYPPKGKKNSNQGPTGNWCSGSFCYVELSLTYDSAWEKGNAYSARAKKCRTLSFILPSTPSTQWNLFNWLRCTTALWKIWFTDIHCSLNFIAFMERAMHKICWTWRANQSQSALRSLLCASRQKSLSIYWNPLVCIL